MTLEDAKKEIEQLRDECGITDREIGLDDALAILAKVETPEPDEEGRAVLWLINRPESDYRIMFDKETKSYAYYYEEEEVGEWVMGWRDFNPVTEAKKLGWGG